MRLLRRPRSDPFAASPLEVEVGHEPRAFLAHFCPSAEYQRLLGVEFTAEERRALSSGGDVTVVMSCDRCIWERPVVFRLAR